MSFHGGLLLRLRVTQVKGDNDYSSLTFIQEYEREEVSMLVRGKHYPLMIKLLTALQKMDVCRGATLWNYTENLGIKCALIVVEYGDPNSG